LNIFSLEINSYGPLINGYSQLDKGSGFNRPCKVGTPINLENKVGTASTSRGNSIMLSDSLGCGVYLPLEEIVSSLSIFILLFANSGIGLLSFLSNSLDVVTPKTGKNSLKELALKLALKVMNYIQNI
jgi:hypothetical protein